MRDWILIVVIKVEEVLSEDASELTGESMEIDGVETSPDGFVVDLND